ncbi:MAG: hypothetical protein EXX96DRAFT_580669 [Benjaminiella poitrasii]|nr:MAG: hypothetical protein EXX96DRAFT_580669 [Benjaminiella poitrasii]
MDNYIFIKVAELPAFEKIQIKNSHVEELTFKCGVHVNAALSFNPSSVSLLANVGHEFSKKKTKTIEMVYEIEPDSQTTRTIYRVYQCEYPFIDHNDTSYSIYQQSKMLIKKVAHKTTFHSKEMTPTKFVFFACIENDDDNRSCEENWPDRFLKTEPHVDLLDLQKSLSKWQCLDKTRTKIKMKTAYIRMKATEFPVNISHHHHHFFFSREFLYNQICLTAVKKEYCKNCRHVWTINQLRDMIQYTENLPKETSRLYKRVGHLQETHKDCGLWQLYFPALDVQEQSLQTKAGTSLYNVLFQQEIYCVYAFIYISFFVLILSFMLLYFLDF